MFANKKEEISKEIVDSGLGDSFPDDIEEGVKHLTIHDNSELSRSDEGKCSVEDGVDQGLVLNKDQDGDNALHLAIANGKEDLSLQIISVLSFESINAQNYYGQTPLMVSVMVNMPNIVKALIGIGANLKLCDSFGNNIIHLAAEYGNNSSLLEIIRSCATFKTIYLDLLDSRNYEGFTPFHVAIRKQKFETAKLLINSGADVNAMDYRAGFTSLHHLVQYGNLGHIQQFIDQFQPDIDAQSYSGFTPLHLTLSKDLIDVADLLIINGADTEMKCMDGISWSSSIHTFQ